MALNEPLDVGTIYRSDTRPLSSGVPNEYVAPDGIRQPLNDYVDEKQELRQEDEKRKIYDPLRGNNFGEPIPEVPEPQPGNKIAFLRDQLEQNDKRALINKAYEATRIKEYLDDPDYDRDYTGDVISGMVKGAFHTISRFMEGDPRAATEVALMFGVLGLPFAKPGSLGAFGGKGGKLDELTPKRLEKNTANDRVPEMDTKNGPVTEIEPGQVPLSKEAEAQVDAALQQYVKTFDKDIRQEMVDKGKITGVYSRVRELENILKDPALDPLERKTIEGMLKKLKDKNPGEVVPIDIKEMMETVSPQQQAKAGFGNRISVEGEPAGHFGGGVGDVNINTAYPNLFKESEKTIAAQKAQARAGQLKAKDFEDLRAMYHLSRRLDEANYLVTKMIQEAEAAGRTLTATDKTLIKMRDSLEGQLTKLEKQIANKPQSQKSPEQQPQAQGGRPPKETRGDIAEILRRAAEKESGIPAKTSKPTGFTQEVSTFIKNQDIPILGSRTPIPDLVEIVVNRFPALGYKRGRDAIREAIERQRAEEIFKALAPPEGKRLNEDTGAPGASSRGPRKDRNQLELDLSKPLEEPTRALETVPRKPIYSAQGKRVLVPGKEGAEARKKLRDYRRDLRNKKLDY